MIFFYHLFSNIGKKKSCLEFPALTLKRRVIPGTSNSQINEKKPTTNIACTMVKSNFHRMFIISFFTSEIYLIEANSLNHFL